MHGDHKQTFNHPSPEKKTNVLFTKPKQANSTHFRGVKGAKKKKKKKEGIENII
jgi:hypothetical protein